MGLTDKIAPAAGNIKDTVQAAMQPYAGSLSGDTPIVEETVEAVSNGASWLTGPALNGKSVQLHCREACLPLCSSLGSNTNNTLPCWNDAPSSNVIFGKNVGTLGSASVLALILVLANMLGFMTGQKVDMNRARERVPVDYETLKQRMDMERLKQNVPDMNKIKESAVDSFGKLKENMTMEKMKQNAAALTGKTDNSNAAPPTINVVDNEVDHELAKGL